MILNWHSHLQPPEQSEAPEWQGRCPMTLDTLTRIHDQEHVDKVVVSNTIHYIKKLSDAHGLKAIQRWDEYVAKLEHDDPKRIIGFASTVPGGGPEFLKELERSITEYKLHGVLINSSHKGHYPDEDEARGFFELVTALDIPVFIHAPASSFGEEAMNMYRLISSV